MTLPRAGRALGLALAGAGATASLGGAAILLVALGPMAVRGGVGGLGWYGAAEVVLRALVLGLPGIVGALAVRGAVLRGLLLSAATGAGCVLAGWLAVVVMTGPGFVAAGVALLVLAAGAPGALIAGALARMRRERGDSVALLGGAAVAVAAHLARLFGIA